MAINPYKSTKSTSKTQKPSPSKELPEPPMRRASTACVRLEKARTVAKMWS